MPNERFWLYEWIDNLGIAHQRQAQTLLEDRVALEDLRERASSIPFTTEPLPPGDAPTIVAGRAMDLSGSLDCLEWECVQRQVDILFNHVWHYFDRIVLVGPSAHQISSQLNSKPGVPPYLYTFIRLLLYLREIGAEDLLLFRQKRPACELHLRDHLREVGIEDAESQTDSLVPTLAEEAEIKLSHHENHIHYRFDHSGFEHTIWGSISSGFQGDLRQAVARAVAKKYLAALASDLYTAQSLRCALGSTIRFHSKLLNRETGDFQNEAVAFQLELPVVDGLDARTLLKIRNDERPAFDRFRRALSTAIDARLADDHKSNSAKIANDIRRDVIDPALTDIELRLQIATKSLRQKTSNSLAIYGVPTIYGLYSLYSTHTLNPLLMAGGLAAANALNNAVHTYIEKRADVSLSDMFFLWQAQKHAH